MPRPGTAGALREAGLIGARFFEWEGAGRLQRIERSIDKATGKLDDIEGRNPGLIAEGLVTRRGDLAGRHQALADRLG